jgi:ferredoxin/flavodoxin---NADP+ reductase
MRAAFVGAGPSGFYAADQLLAAGFEVDLLDALPTPFGLVRAGVAPDHPKIKSVTRVYEKDGGEAGLPVLRGRSAGRAHLARGPARARA